jgi:membrane-associated phospholipid phosphatase
LAPTGRPISSHKALRFAGFALSTLALYWALGSYVSHQPPTPLDRDVAQAMLGHDLWLAFAGYKSGLFPTFAALCVVTIVISLSARQWRGRVVFVIAALLAAWVVSDRFKALFDRPRPEHWLLVHETSPSYSSGHATNSLVFYGLWAYYLWRSDLPPAIRFVGAGALGIWCLVVAWSRLAMGAHYLTDILGGWLLAIVVVCTLAAIVAIARPRTAAREA